MCLCLCDTHIKYEMWLVESTVLLAVTHSLTPHVIEKICSLDSLVTEKKILGS